MGCPAPGSAAPPVATAVSAAAKPSAPQLAAGLRGTQLHGSGRGADSLELPRTAAPVPGESGSFL